MNLRQEKAKERLLCLFCNYCYTSSTLTTWNWFEFLSAFRWISRNVVHGIINSNPKPTVLVTLILFRQQFPFLCPQADLRCRRDISSNVQISNHPSSLYILNYNPLLDVSGSPSSSPTLIYRNLATTAKGPLKFPARGNNNAKTGNAQPLTRQTVFLSPPQKHHHQQSATHYSNCTHCRWPEDQKCK